jgi:hypothetical protein
LSRAKCSLLIKISKSLNSKTKRKLVLLGIIIIKIRPIHSSIIISLSTLMVLNNS